MSLIRDYRRFAQYCSFCMAWLVFAVTALAQGVSTTTVQGTVYLANGAAGSGTLQISWPAFTTAANQPVAAGRLTTSIGADGFVSVNLTPNLGASPAGLFYTAVYHLSDGTTSTEYWVIPAAAQASIAQVRSQVMPAAQAVQAVSKAYVDQAVESVAQGNLNSTGGQLTGPLYLTGDPTQSLQAADKHYVDAAFAQALPLTGGAATGPLTAPQLGAVFQVDQFGGGDFGAKLQACLAAVNSAYGGTCDARNFTGNLAMGANLTISTGNAALMLPCATISTASQIIVTAGTRNVSIRGCALRGGSSGSGSQGGTVLLYSGAVAAIQVGDKTYASDTLGFHLENVLINTTGSSSASTQAIAAYRTQELNIQSVYLLGNSNQTGMKLDGTGNYTGGTFSENHISGFQTGISGVGHQVTNSAATDWLNASTFARLHINCPTANGNPVSGTFGINLQQGDGNTFTGGDVEGCATALHLGQNAQNNTVVGLRNENSTYQVVADAGSSYNSWITGGTMFTGKLSDSGTRNSFLDAFHRSFNSLNGDWYGSQQDSTITNHFRLGTGSGNERGLLDRYQTDFGYRWTMGLSDATGGEQYYQILDELNNVYRLSIGQYNSGQGSTNNQTVINAAGSGAVVLNGSNNSGTGGVVFGSGGPNETTVATVSNAGNAQFNGALLVGGTSQSAGTMTVRNNADAEVDYYLWPGLTSSQKGSFTYKDYNGNSQWFLVKDGSNNWAVNSAIGGLDSFKAYQSTNSGDTYVNASSAAGVVRVNYEPGSGSAFNVYGGGSSNLYASFSGTSAIKFPGLSASSGRNCLQIDSSGYISNTGAACGTGSGSGTVNSGSSGQIAYYSGSGAAVSGVTTVPVSAGGTGASTAAGALSALGGASLVATASQNFAGPINASLNSQINVMAPPYNAKGDCVTDDHDAIMAAQAAALTYAHGSTTPGVLYFPKPPGGCYLTSTIQWQGVSLEGQPSAISAGSGGVVIQGKPGQDILHVADPSTTANAPRYYGQWSVRNVAFNLDDSVAANFPHRWPGRWFDDGAMTAGSPAFTSVSALISCGDAGQAIQVNGAGPGGSNLVTTIQSVSPCWTSAGQWQVVTLAAAASTTVTNAHSYISVAGIPVTTTIGNAAISMDDYDANPANWATQGGGSGGGYTEMQNVSFSTVSYTNGGKNNTVAIYTQGNGGIYAPTFDHVNIVRYKFGVVQGVSELNSTYASDSGDYQRWQHILFNGDTYPWISYNGGDGSFEDVELTTSNGPQFLQLQNRYYDTLDAWHFNAPEFEGGGGVVGWRIEGMGHTADHLGLGPSSTMPAVIDTSNMTCLACSWTGLHLNGANNRIYSTGDEQSGQITTDGGIGNEIQSSFQSNPVNTRPQAHQKSMIPYKGSNTLLGRFTPDAAQDGNFSAFYNHDDFFFWPKEIQFNASGSGAWSTRYADDAASPTGGYINLNNSLGVTLANKIGTATAGQQNFPATSGTLFFEAKCLTGTSFDMQIIVYGPGYGVVTDPTFSCSTSYQFYSMRFNVSSYTGLTLAAQPYGTQMVSVAWMYARPDLADINGKSIVGAGTAMTTGPGGGTSAGHIATFADANGTIQDSGKGAAGSGAAYTTGPASGTIANHIATFAGTNGQIQDSGTTLSGITPLAGTTGSIGGAALVAGACTSGTVNVAGAGTTMAAVATPASYPGDGVTWNAYVSSAGIVTVKVCATVPVTPSPSAYNVRVIQ